MNATDLKQIDELLEKRLAQQKKEIKKDFQDAIDDAVAEIIGVVDKHKADKEDVEALSDRVTTLENLR